MFWDLMWAISLLFCLAGKSFTPVGKIFLLKILLLEKKKKASKWVEIEALCPFSGQNPTKVEKNDRLFN